MNCFDYYLLAIGLAVTVTLVSLLQRTIQFSNNSWWFMSLNPGFDLLKLGKSSSALLFTFAVGRST